MYLKDAYIIERSIMESYFCNSVPCHHMKETNQEFRTLKGTIYLKRHECSRYGKFILEILTN
jgi:hypothetical protein